MVDPTKVTRSALQNAESIASMILTTESLVADKKKKNVIVVEEQMQECQIWAECINKRN